MPSARTHWTRTSVLSAFLFCASCLLPEVESLPSPESTSNGTTKESAQSTNIAAADGGHVEGAAAPSSAAEPAAAAGMPASDVQGSADVAVDAVAQQGQPCSTVGKLACTKPGSFDHLMCNGSSWVSAGSCEIGERCNTEDPARIGECVFAQIECRGKEPNAPYCASESLIRVCGPDLLTARNLPLCALPTPDCQDGMCTCLNVCDGACRDLSADSAHCGQCGHGCGGGECVMGECHAVMLAQEPHPVSGRTQLAQDDAHVYWTSLTGVASVAKSGGPIKMLASRKQAGGGIVADASFVYWGDNTSGVISKVSRSGGNAVDIATGVKCNYLAVDAKYLYIASVDKGVQKLLLQGGAPEVVAADQGFVSALAVDAQFVYWGSQVAIMKAPIAGGPASQLASTPDGVFGLALSNNELFWVSNSNVMRLAVSGGRPTMLAAAGNATGIAADSSHVYALGWELSRVSIADGLTEVLLRKTSSTEQFVIDDTSVYWMSSTNIMKFSK